MRIIIQCRFCLLNSHTKNMFVYLDVSCQSFICKKSFLISTKMQNFFIWFLNRMSQIGSYSFGPITNQLIFNKDGSEFTFAEQSLFSNLLIYYFLLSQLDAGFSVHQIKSELQRPFLGSLLAVVLGLSCTLITN